MASRIKTETGRSLLFARREESQPPFKAKIALRRQRLEANGLQLPIVAGMQAQAEIREGERTILEYLLSPVKRMGAEAGGER